MHVLQWIAIADEEDKDMALRVVRNNLEEFMGNDYSSNTWYDWFVAGGGRWNMEENEPLASAYEDKTNMVLSVEEDGIEAIKDRITKCIDNRIAEFNTYRKTFTEKNVDINNVLDKYDGSMDFSFELYDLGKMIDMLNGEWDFNSYFYDMSNYSTNPKYLLQRLDNNEKNWYLIPVDFHF